MNAVDAAWVAGIIEGEGSMCATRNYVRIRVVMTDHDVLAALHSKTGMGTIRGPYRVKLSTKDCWEWAVRKRQDAENLIKTVLPFLFERRTLQALVCLDHIDGLNAKRDFKAKFCNLGHERAEVGRTSRGSCLACSKLWQQTSALKLKARKVVS